MSQNRKPQNIDYSLCNSIDTDILYEYRVLPLKRHPLYTLVAYHGQEPETAVLAKIFNHPVKLLKEDKNFIDMELRDLELKKELYNNALNALQQQNSTRDTSNILSFLDLLLKYSIKNPVSDIHIESTLNSTLIRVRMDGALNSFFSFDKKLFTLLGSIIKLLGNLDISQKRLPLNSRFTRNILKRDYDFRISTIPTIHGESIVLRILDNQNIAKKLDSIGFEDSTLDKIKDTLSLNQGLILVTGPTGSGKTTTLYSMLNHINSSEKKIITIEDPVEYKLDGIIQVNLNHDIDLDYNLVLKNILRQDPDILMIGEIRDPEALQIALRASLTGHLVIATLHTNNAAETISRLLDLGAKPFLVSTTLKLILSQRLLRTLCPDCKTYDARSKSHIPGSCEKCNLTGYKNRQIVDEILYIDKNIQKVINQDCDISKIFEYARQNNFRTLKQNGALLVEKGLTSHEELKSKI